jgi:NAD(P)H-dependent flavin oxidoreductase YrpB (nitropropane dioxygenase family)
MTRTAHKRAEEFCERFGLSVPILQAPMAGACPVSLAAAVANAGGMGGLTGEPAPEGFRNLRVHDLKHTYGRRLRAVGVSFEDRQDLLGHKSTRITTHYSASELANLIAASEKALEKSPTKLPQTNGSFGRAIPKKTPKPLNIQELF